MDAKDQREAEQQKAADEVRFYGADAAEWLGRWDRGEIVWSIEMGGLGPGYEQSIQITAAEIVRWLLKHKADADRMSDEEAWPTVRDTLRTAMLGNTIIKDLGLSGAQYGAAVSLATTIYMKGPRAVMTDEQMKDRKIQVRRTFPG